MMKISLGKPLGATVALGIALAISKPAAADDPARWWISADSGASASGEADCDANARVTCTQGDWARFTGSTGNGETYEYIYQHLGHYAHKVVVLCSDGFEYSSGSWTEDQWYAQANCPPGMTSTWGGGNIKSF
jgi:hypothetical protein